MEEGTSQIVDSEPIPMQIVFVFINMIKSKMTCSRPSRKVEKNIYTEIFLLIFDENMGLSSQGQQGSSGLNNLKELIQKLKKEYQNVTPNYKKWPCPFCIHHSKTLIQCRVHILRDHESTCKRDNHPK